jgi:hypothetical protein
MMGDSLSIACRDCKKSLCVGQDSAGGAVIYSKNEGLMNVFEEFLYEHEEHDIVFTRKIGDTRFDYDEIDVEPYIPIKKWRISVLLRWFLK